MNVSSRYTSFFATAFLAFAAGVFTPFSASAATLDLPNVPLPVNVGTIPNIFLQMDDSGSMDRDILTPQHFTTCMYNPSLNCNTVLMFEHMIDAIQPAPLEGDPIQICAGPLDADCDGICTVAERLGNDWDTNCSGTCEAGVESIDLWDANCNGVCDVGSEGESWDLDCNSLCEGTEACPVCEPWDQDCDSVCDWIERYNCPSGCSIGATCAPTCASWDGDCNGVCDTYEQAGPWDTNCNYLCDATEQSTPWDTNCNGTCDAGVESETWDADCSGVCDGAETCPVCAFWDTSCDGVCDVGESCTIACETWDTSCDGVCDTGENCIDTCESWDTNCNGVCNDSWYSGNENCPSGCSNGDTCYDVCAALDADCNGICEAGESESWDTNCSGVCEGAEACYSACASWDTDCDGVCDNSWYGGNENCPTGCTNGDTCYKTCEAWDTSCDGICDANEQSALWDTNCNSQCDAGEQSTTWDTNCDGSCDVGVEGASWDLDCSGVCDANEQSALWDTNCNGVCDAGTESAIWDTNCDTICDLNEQSASWDANCNSQCDAGEQSTTWDTNCNSQCDAGEGIAAWDTNCDGVCNATTEGAGDWDANCNNVCDSGAGETCPVGCETWDLDCDGTCDSGETCPVTCYSWDLDCDLRCDSGETCPSSCSSWSTCDCEIWDDDCDGNCDWNENCGTTGTCPSSDLDCNCPASDPYCVTRGSCPISDPNCACGSWDPYCVTGDPSTCPDDDLDCNCPSDDPYCVTRGSCPVWDPNCNCPWYDDYCVTNAQLEDSADWVANIGGINQDINNYLSFSVSVPASASGTEGGGSEATISKSSAPPDIPMAEGGSTPPPSLPEGKNRKIKIEAIGDGEMATFEYFYDTPDNVLSASRCSGNGNSTYENCFTGSNENDFDWRARSSDLNVLFFNSDITYEPWVGYTDASFSGARSQPVSSLPGYTDLFNLDGFFYHYWIDDKGFTGSQPTGDNALDGANNFIDQWDSHVKVTVTSLSFSCDLFTYRPDTFNLNLLITPLSTSDPLCLAALGRNPSLADLQQNVANWYQYYRKRLLVAKAAVSGVVTEQPSFRYGLSLINDSSTFVEMPPAATTDFTVHNAGLIETYQNSSLALYTPLRRGLEAVGNYYAGNTSGKPTPIIEACQKNFAILFTDGFWNRSDPNNPSGDFDGDGGLIGSEDILLADVAKYFYDTDLAPQFDDTVPPDDWDTAVHQHMVDYTIGFGITGRLSDTDADGWPNDFNPYIYTGPWYLAGSSDDQKKVDDLWHAAWNGRGAYYSARRPDQLIAALGAAIQDIGDRSGSSASAAANAGSLSETSQIFQAKYDSSDWHGELIAYPVDSTSGDLQSANWEAGALLTAKPESFFANQSGGRQMFTWDDIGNTGSPFIWGSDPGLGGATGLNAVQQAVLDINPDSGDPDGEGEARLQYIRGSAVDEGAGNFYRVRTNMLGDLIHSSLQFIGDPSFFYPFDNYLTFVNTNANRMEMIYVGGNDGMLHAFRADTGAELFAYVPNDLMPKLNKLTSTNYGHEFYVDGPMDYGDAYIGGAWKSVLAGTLRSGGQAIYALDVTDPTTFSASNVLWEFSDEDDPDLGNVMGQPQIKKMANGKWAVIVSSSYNNTDVDGGTSISGNSYIFVLYIEDGMNGWSSGDYTKILVSGADGLTTPAVADVDGDDLADFIYVGDINGNMWKIDVTSTNESAWNVAFSGSPLFTATESVADGSEAQSITTRPAVKTHPLGIRHGVLVLWGTGKYYEILDDTTINQPVQSVYSIWDRAGYYNRALNERHIPVAGDWGFSRETDLVSPKIIVDVASNTRIIDPDSLVDASGNPLTPVWYDASGDPVDRGWVVDLPEPGERVTQQIILRDDLAFFVTLIPEENVCVPGSTGWLMVLNAETGNSTQFPVFDITDDNIVDSSDILTVGGQLNGSPGTTTQVSGVTMQAMPNLPVFLYDDRPSDFGEVFPPSPNSARSCGSGGARAFSYTTQADGTMVKITTAPQPLACGRQNWIQQR